MSATATAWAWRQTTRRPREMLVLLALAERTGCGRGRHPVADLAVACRLKPFRVLEIIAGLQAAGLLRWSVAESSDKLLSIELATEVGSWVQ